MGPVELTLIPLKATYAPGEPIEIEVVGSTGPVEATLWHLDRPIQTVTGTGLLRFDAVPVGGYGISAAGASTAVDVLDDPLDRPRYGFVADFPAGHDPAALVDTARRLHLSAIQFYDWAHRYAQLVPDTDDYLDPLGRPLSLPTVRALTAALRSVASLSMGYAAVYAVGGVDWPAWAQAGLFTADGEPHRFTDDLLLIVDPANPGWMKHFAADLRASVAAAGFDGFHLDSYGWPKRAFRADGSVADLTEGFATLLEHLRDEVPDARLLFNNVNDFPTWSTAHTRQDGTYIEVWPPHTTLGHLGALVGRARSFNPTRVPIIAAYLTAYRDHPVEVADRVAQLAMATIFSHGGTHLLNGEGGRVLVDPYYPRNHQASPSTQELMRRSYDFLVRYGDLLLDPTAVDVTRSYTGGINEDIVLGGARFSTDPEPGTIWVRVVRGAHGLVLHLINLADQAEIGWDTPKAPVTPVTGATLRWLRTLATRVPLVATPDEPALRPVPVELDGRYQVSALPALGSWTMIVLPE